MKVSEAHFDDHTHNFTIHVGHSDPGLDHKRVSFFARRALAPI
jgi:hypothetical protein